MRLQCAHTEGSRGTGTNNGGTAASLETHICWSVLNDDNLEPPIQTEYLRSSGATTLIFMVDGAKAVNSHSMRSTMPSNMVVPPDRTMLRYKSSLMAASHFMIDWTTVSWMPLASLPMKFGWKSASGQRKRSQPTVMTIPSGSSYVFSLELLSAAALWVLVGSLSRICRVGFQPNLPL